VIIAREIIDLKGDLKEDPLIGTGPFIIEKASRRRIQLALASLAGTPSTTHPVK
jgi:hypothetical protein